MKRISLKSRRLHSGSLRAVLIAQIVLSALSLIIASMSGRIPQTPNPEYLSPFGHAELLAAMLLGVLLILGAELTLAEVPEAFVNGRGHFAAVDFSIFILLVAVWLLFETRIAASYIANLHIVKLCSYFIFSLLPSAFLIFEMDCVKHQKLIFGAMSAISLGVFFVNYLLLLVYGFSLPPTLPIFHLLLVVGILISAYCLVREIHRHRNASLIPTAAALLMFCAFALAGIISYYFTQNSFSALLTFIGLILMVLIIGADLVRHAEGELADARAFASIADFMPSGVFRARNDARLTIIYANDTFYRFYGYKNAAQAIENGFLGANDHVDFSEANEAYARRLKLFSEGIYRYEAQTCETDNEGESVYMLNRLAYRPDTDEIYASVLDITDRVAVEEELKVREEEYRIVSEQSNKYILRYDIARATITQSQKAAEQFALPRVLENIPDNPLLTELIAGECLNDYHEFFRSMSDGCARGTAALRMFSAKEKELRWYRFEFTTVFSDSGEAKYGIVSFFDNTQQREKDLAYQKWQQELLGIPASMRAVFECNLSIDSLDKADVALSGLDMQDIYPGFDERTARRAPSVHPQEREEFVSLLSRERLLSDYSRGIFSHELKYRAKNEHGEYRWLKLSMQLVKYPDSDEIKAYILVIDIDEEYRRELLLREQSETDPLTGVLNRRTFIERSRALLEDCGEASLHAFVMIDLDGFKSVNDNLGHAKGDELLISVSSSLRSLLREGDLVGRMGGDEFMLCIKKIPGEEIAEKRAMLIRQLLFRRLESELIISASIGISIFPRDGKIFEELYKNADAAMYHSKSSGGNISSVYHPDMTGRLALDELTPIDPAEQSPIGDDELTFSPTSFAMSRVISEKLSVVSLRLDVGSCRIYADSGFSDYLASRCLPSELMDKKYLSVWVAERDVRMAQEQLSSLLTSPSGQAEFELHMKCVGERNVLCRIFIVAERSERGEPENIYASIRPLNK